MKRALVLSLLVGLVPSAAAGNYYPPPGDAFPAWSPDGTRIAFTTTRGAYNYGRLAVVQADGSGETPVHNGYAAALSPDWKRVAALRGVDQELVVDGQVIARSVWQFSWAPDSARLAYSSASGGLFVVDADGGNLRHLADRGSYAAWSTSGDRIAYQSYDAGTTDIHVVAPDGSGDINLTSDPGLPSIRPIWAPDGRTLAYVTGHAPALRLVDLAGRRRKVPVKVEITNGEIAWFPDGRRIAVESGGSLRVVDVRTGRSRKWLPFGAGLVWSPDGRQLAFAAGGECRDLRGIYVAKGDGTEVRRITNDCRIVGTPGPDNLRGTGLADVLLGLGGDDRLAAEDPGYMGDTLLGGPGKDILLGDFQNDTLHGGTGPDRLRGGPSGDKLIGGPGRDVINGEGGLDVIYGRDGVRDLLICGTNGPTTKPERDTVYADRFDRVARDCEVVHRAR